MPKKKSYNFKSLQGASFSTSKQPGGQDAGQQAPSVNERLQDLRKVQAKDAETKKRQLAEAANQRSVPPEVRGILGLSETAPPRPKASARMRDRRRVPGPAPPKSWLAAPSSAWKPCRKADSSMRSKSRVLLRFNRLTGLEVDVIDRQPSSFTHIILKRIAESWDLLEEEDYDVFTQLPFRLRLILLSYLSFHGCTLNVAGFQALTQGNELIPSLDLAGLVGHRNLTLKRICRTLESPMSPPCANDADRVTESWEIPEHFETALQLSSSIHRFSNLTHLCLSHPAQAVSWKDLLSLFKHTQQITHLSLAYWPRPTLTPNLSTTTVSSQHSPDISAGGSHYYSGIDRDLSEPASLLRQMSHHLLCLQWFDLEGCEEWTPALAMLSNNATEVTENDGWTTSLQMIQPVFASHWKNLNHIRCSQGWLPSLNGIQGLSERRDGTIIDSVVVNGLVKYLRENECSGIAGPQYAETTLDTERKWARLWLERECSVTYAGMRINGSRREHGLRPITLDFGWTERYSPTI